MGEFFSASFPVADSLFFCGFEPLLQCRQTCSNALMGRAWMPRTHFAMATNVLECGRHASEHM